MNCTEKIKLCEKCSNSTGLCTNCKKNSKFGNNSTNCTCFPNFNYNKTTDKCKSDCPRGQYLNSSLNKCKNCDKLCKNCFGESNKNCIKCVKNAILNDTTCACKKDYTFSQEYDGCKRTTPLPIKKCEKDFVFNPDTGNCTSKSK